MSQELNEEFLKNPLNFVKQHPVVPPSDLGQKLKNLSVVFDEANVGEFVKETGDKEVISGDTDPRDMIRWIDFKTTTSMNEPGAMTFSGSKTKTEGHIPAYFLPWRSMHVVSMTMPALSHRDYDQPMERNPHIFFTAAINGCSVFVRGNPTCPDVSHAGIDGTLTLDAAAFWRDALDVVVLGRPGSSGVKREINKSNYTKDSRHMRQKAMRCRTAMAEEYMNWLESEHRDRLTIQEVAPWGCVFGVRYGRLWSFYLQENATVSTLEFVKKSDLVDPKARWIVTKSGLNVEKQTQVQKGFLGIKTKKTVYAACRRTTQPMRVSDFYPGGKGAWSSEPAFKRQ